MKKILQWVGLAYDPRRSIPTPFEATDQPKQKGREKPKTEDPDFFAGTRPFKMEFSEDGFDANEIKTNRGRISANLTEEDLQEIRRRKLNKAKAEKVKPFFAAGSSAKVAARNFKKGEGFGARTLDDYWAAFNSAIREFNPSPAG
jgi:hypothetical protein